MQGLTEALPRNDSPGENQAICKCDMLKTSTLHIFFDNGREENQKSKSKLSTRDVFMLRKDRIS